MHLSTKPLLGWIGLQFVLSPTLALCLGASSVRDTGVEPLRVVTTLGFLADLTRAVGGEYVSVEVLAAGHQDPHYVEPTPVLMQATRRADLLIEVGLQLELWCDKVAAGSGNTAIQMGQPGRLIASKGIATLELPEVLSREWGDVHPYGNPHVWLDPLNAKTMAANIAGACSALDAEHAAEFAANLAEFNRRLDEALFGADLVKRVGAKKLSRLAKGGRLEEYLEQREITELLGGWMRKAATLRGRPVVTYHKTWIYLAQRFGFRIPVEIEEKPGIPPSARHRDEVLALMEREGVRTVLEADYYDRTAGEYLARKAGATLVVASIDLDPQDPDADYFSMIDALLEDLVASEAKGD